MKPVALVLSCEHAVNTVPQEFMALFAQDMAILETHRAIDFGALALTSHLGNALQCEHTAASVSRLLIDCNRSLKHPGCFSEFSESLSQHEKKKLIDLYYLPYRTQVEQKIQDLITRQYQVLHLSIHSFTPILNNVVRNADIGLLYHSERHGEKEVARVFRGLLLQKVPLWRVRMNYPYDGKSDGFTSALRKCHQERDYLGIEIECNQALLSHEVKWMELKENLSSSVQELLVII